MKQRPSLGVGAYVVKDGQVLLGYRLSKHNGNVWSAPGGHYEYGETPAAAARREAFEECGIDVPEVAWQLQAITSDVFAESGKHYVTLHMVAHVVEGEPRLAEPEIWREWRWFDDQNLPKPLMQSFANAIDHGFEVSKLIKSSLPTNF